MANPLVECIPNFSEGRRPEVIQAIVTAISSAGAVRLLDTSSDADHNRTVVTFVGTPEAVEEAAFAGIKTAAAHIDLDVQRGEHPRIGATDVVPFVPIRDVKMEDCIAIARRLGKRVGEQLRIPVYLYESAATRPDRENLENIRRGEYEGLKDSIRLDPNRMPDFGPAELGKAGATVIGARPPLIAFNAYLTTGDVEIAKKIARAIRHSSGGMRYVKALGLLVEGKAQVSMNLTNFEKTPIYRVVELIRREAQRYGVGIACTELVGLMPEDALIESARWYLQLDMFQPDQLLEWRLQSVPEPGPQVPEPPIPEGATMLSQAATATVASQVIGNQAERMLTGFIDSVAEGTAAPGGGAVAALAGTLAASLAEMVARLTLGKKKYAAVEADMAASASAAESLRRELLQAVDEDIAAYTSVMEAYRVDKADPRRDSLIQNAMREAAEVPLRVMRLSLEAMRLARTVADKGNANAAIDAAVATHLSMAALEGAGLNVRTNAHALTDPDIAAHLRDTAFRLIDEGRALSAEALSIAETRAGLK
ncbi:MAG: glutamate formimidoyltransferase [Anaerolineae bacterium]|nr:glutamate formimidoyltransferase [Anaerolineae bacterium]